jgi:hypothetical protein
MGSWCSQAIRSGWIALDWQSGAVHALFWAKFRIAGLPLDKEHMFYYHINVALH